MVNWSFLIYSMIAAPCTCIEQTYHFCFSKSYKSILHSSCGAFLFTLWEDWYLSLVIIRNIDSMFIYILLSYCLKIDISWSSQLLHIVTGFNTGRSFFDAFYFCFITFTTIGFGDIVPGIFLFFEKYCMALKLIPFPAQILPRVCIFPPFYSLSFHTKWWVISGCGSCKHSLFSYLAQIVGQNEGFLYRVFFSHWASPKKLKYGNPRLGESTLT